MSSQPRKLVVHVGPPKTASTTLQHALYGSRDLLLNVGILYPEPPPDAHYRTQHADICNAVHARDDEKLRSFAQGVVSQCASRQVDTVLLSSESFS